MMQKQAFSSEKYDESIVATLPYYEEYFKQIIDIVHTFFHILIAWLDIGCGTGKITNIKMERVKKNAKVICLDIIQSISQSLSRSKFMCYKNVDLRT